MTTESGAASRICITHCSLLYEKKTRDRGYSPVSFASWHANRISSSPKSPEPELAGRPPRLFRRKVGKTRSNQQQLENQSSSIPMPGGTVLSYKCKYTGRLGTSRDSTHSSYDSLNPNRVLWIAINGHLFWGHLENHHHLCPSCVSAKEHKDHDKTKQTTNALDDQWDGLCSVWASKSFN